MADLVSKTVEQMCQTWGIERIGFLTLTFKAHVLDWNEAQRRQHSVRTNVLSKRYEAIVRVGERQISGRIHYHYVVVLAEDIRTGFDHEAVARKDYRSANSHLRAEWAFWRKAAPSYGFGRVELKPVRTNAKGIGRYVGGYVTKHVRIREIADKGARLVSISRNAKVGTTHFSWVNENGARWRKGVAKFAARHGIASYGQLAAVFGPKWAYFHRESIWALGEPPSASPPVAPVVPTRAAVIAEFRRVVQEQLHTAPAAKRSAEVPPESPSAQEPPEVPTAPRNAPRRYTVEQVSSPRWALLRARHVEQRPLKLTRHEKEKDTQAVPVAERRFAGESLQR